MRGRCRLLWRVVHSIAPKRRQTQGAIRESLVAHDKTRSMIKNTHDVTFTLPSSLCGRSAREQCFFLRALTTISVLTVPIGKLRQSGFCSLQCRNRTKCVSREHSRAQERERKGLGTVGLILGILGGRDGEPHGLSNNSITKTRVRITIGWRPRGEPLRADRLVALPRASSGRSGPSRVVGSHAGTAQRGGAVKHGPPSRGQNHWTAAREARLLSIPAPDKQLAK